MTRNEAKKLVAGEKYTLTQHFYPRLPPSYEIMFGGISGDWVGYRRQRDFRTGVFDDCGSLHLNEIYSIQPIKQYKYRELK